MAFEVYPVAHTVPLTVPTNPMLWPLTPFVEQATAAPAPAVPNMFIRVVMLGNGCAPPPGAVPPPTFKLKAGAGAEVPVPSGVGVASVFNDAASMNYVAAVRMSAEANGVYRIEAFISVFGSAWQLRIENHDAVQRDFTWVVASTDAESLQPWIHVTSTSLTLEALTNQTIPKDIEIINKGTGSLGVTNVAGLLAGGFSITTVPPAIAPNHCAPMTLTFVASSMLGPGAIVPLVVNSNDPFPQSNFTHNNRVQLQATTRKLEISLMVDGSGSMEARPDGTFGTLAESRWAKLKVAAGQLLTLLGNFAGDQGRFAMGVFPDIVSAAVVGPSAINLQAPGDITQNAITNATNQLASHDPRWRSTPIGKAIEVAIGGTPATFGHFESSMNAQTFNRRFVVLMSDGAHNLGPPNPPDFYPVMPATGISFTDKHVKFVTIGYGEPESPTLYDVDHVLLNVIAANSGGSFHFSGVSNDGLDIAKTFRTAISSTLSLDYIVDPAVVLTAGASDFRREVTVLPYDTKVSFVVDWATDNLPVSVTLITPLCEVITKAAVPVNAAFNSHPRYQIFTFDSAFLQNSANSGSPRFGAWKLIVAAPELTKSERVVYDVITESGLRLDLAFDRPRFFAGDAYRLDATLTLRGLPVRNALVTLSLKRPGHSVDKVIADTLVTAGEFEQIEKKFEGRELTRTGMRVVALNQKGIKLQGFSQVSEIPMLDPNDTGVYSADITGSFIPGNYEYHVTATGETADGVAFRREQRIKARVEVRPDPDFSFVDMGFVRLQDMVTAVIRVYPRDKFDNPYLLMEPALDRTFEFIAKGAEFVTGIQTLGDGSYSRAIRYEAKAAPVIQVRTADGDITPKISLPALEGLQYVDQVLEFKKGREAERGANKHAQPRNILGDVTTKETDRFVALGERGSVTVAIKGQVIRAAGKGQGDVIVFVRAATHLRPYRVEAQPARGDKWVVLGSSPGVTRSFNLSKAGLKTTRALRVVDESSSALNTDLSVSDSPGVNVLGVGVRRT